MTIQERQDLKQFGRSHIEKGCAIFVTHPLLFLQPFLHHFGGVSHTAYVGLSHTDTIGLSHTVFPVQKERHDRNKKKRPYQH